MTDTATIPLTRGMYAVVDADDFCLVADRSWQASKRRDGDGWYAVSDGVRMHRLILGISDDSIVDHRDGNGLNNRRRNIRVGTQSLNCVNRRRTPGPYLRGARPKKGLWQAYIKQGGKQCSLGYFPTEKDAHSAYLAEAMRRYGDWMPLPEPPEITPRDEPSDAVPQRSAAASEAPAAAPAPPSPPRR